MQFFSSDVSKFSKISLISLIILSYILLIAAGYSIFSWNSKISALEKKVVIPSKSQSVIYIDSPKDDKNKNYHLELYKLSKYLKLNPEETRIFKSISCSYLSGLEQASNSIDGLNVAFDNLAAEIQNDSIQNHGNITEEDARQITFLKNISIKLQELKQFEENEKFRLTSF